MRERIKLSNKSKFEKLLTVLAWVALFAAAFAVGWRSRDLYEEQRNYYVLEYIMTVPEPEQCALCGGDIPYHAPCLVDLSTGQVGELTVYTNHPAKQGELAPAAMQQTGTFRFLPCAGLMAVQDTCAHTCSVTLPAKWKRMDPAPFCMGCRTILATAALKQQYAVVNLHDLPYLQVYPIYKGWHAVIRDYQVTVTARKDGSLDVCVTGLVDF